MSGYVRGMSDGKQPHPVRLPRRKQGGIGLIQDGRARILAAAEKIFSEQGYEGCSLRQVAQLAETPLSLATYHFGDKLSLYREVFRARMPELVQQRLTGLAIADLETEADRKLEMIVKALLVPMLGLRATERGRCFAVLFAREAADPASEERGIIRDLLAPVTDATLARLLSCFPERDAASVLWAYGAMIGAMLYMLAGANRLREVSGGIVDANEVQICSQQLVSIALAGLRREQPPR